MQSATKGTLEKDRNERSTKLALFRKKYPWGWSRTADKEMTFDHVQTGLAAGRQQKPFIRYMVDSNASHVHKTKNSKYS
jgi:hypothetical protein